MYEALKQTINTNLPNNTSGAITPALLRNTLLAIISALSEEGQFMGIASTNTTPEIATNGKGWYIAYTAGTYTNFGGTTLSQGDIYIFSYNGSTWAYNEITYYLTDRLSTAESTIASHTTSISNVTKSDAFKSICSPSQVINAGENAPKVYDSVENARMSAKPHHHAMILNYIYKVNNHEYLRLEIFKGASTTNVEDEDTWKSDENWETIKEVTLT